jgi:hypothetical protein
MQFLECFQWDSHWLSTTEKGQQNGGGEGAPERRPDQPPLGPSSNQNGGSQSGACGSRRLKNDFC